MNQLFSGTGEVIVLATELGRGGEGTVYQIKNNADHVAKVFHKPPEAIKAAKLSGMVQMRTDRLVKLSAWPLATLHQRPSGPVVGFVMPRATGFKPIHQLYGPKSRLHEFPKADWGFLAHTASNLARAFQVFHDHHLVIGDVNHDNAVVSNVGTVMLIDCDSFQVSIGRTIHRCEVGVPTHTPPELQGQSLQGVTRTSNHDAFGLAVLIFQLLFMGRHPFAGVYLGAGEMPLERAVREFRFAYGNRAASALMKAPPGVPDLGVVGPAVASLFERSFAPAGAQPQGRPVAQEWVTALSQLMQTVRRCSANPSHTYPGSAATCPWCKIEGSSGVLLFGVYVYDAHSGKGTFRLEDVWADIQRIPGPGPAPSIPTPKSSAVTPSPHAKQAAEERSKWLLVGWLLGGGVGLIILVKGGPLLVAIMVGFMLAGAVISVADKTGSRVAPELRAKAEAARRQARDLELRWQREASDQAFQQRLQELQLHRQEYLALGSLRNRKLAELQSGLRQKQLERFLDNHRIDMASISGIGPGRKATLQSWGIETALDVVRPNVHRVPGFGPSLTRRLLEWRARVESQFVFDPRKGIDPNDVAQVDKQVWATRQRLEQDLLRGAADLRKLSQQIQSQRNVLAPLLLAAVESLAQAEAELRQVSR